MAPRRLPLSPARRLTAAPPPATTGPSSSNEGLSPARSPHEPVCSRQPPSAIQVRGGDREPAGGGALRVRPPRRGAADDQRDQGSRYSPMIRAPSSRER